MEMHLLQRALGYNAIVGTHINIAIDQFSNNDDETNASQFVITSRTYNSVAYPDDNSRFSCCKLLR